MTAWSEALAGTMPKSADPKILENSEKDNREHAFVVDAINESFKEFCSAFDREKKPSFLK